MSDDAPPFTIGAPRPDSPVLARPGRYGVGVHALEIVDADRLDVAAALTGRADPRGDRRLDVELFYPAQVRPDAPPQRYRDRFATAGDNGAKRTTTFTGRAQRDAEPDRSGAPHPLVVLSHGFLGSRFMLSNLAENLASKGYVVAALGHRDETAPGAACFPATLLNRPLDQLFALDALEERSSGGDERLAGLIDVGRSAVVGYSMGGYGALNVGGAGFAADFVTRSGVPPAALAERQSGFVRADPRVKAIVALAPWGGPAALAASGHPGSACWDAAGLAGLAVPTLFVAGSDDDISGYEGGVRWLFEAAVGSDRFLLVYRHARHNIGPNPPPEEAWSDPEMFERYAEPVWDVRRINDVNQHFVTAFLGARLRGEALSDFLERPCVGEWLGFPARTALGLELHRGR